VLEGSLLYISISELLFHTFPIFFDLAIHILLLHFPIEHCCTIPCPYCSRAQRHNNSVEFQSFGHRCYHIRHCMACHQQHHFEFVFHLFPTCLPLCVAYFVLYCPGLHINTPASGFVKSQATAAPFLPLSSCVILCPTPVSLLSCSHHSDLLVLISCLLTPLPLPTASTLTTTQDNRYVDADTLTSSLLPFSSCAFSISRDRGLLSHSLSSHLWGSSISIIFRTHSQTPTLPYSV